MSNRLQSAQGDAIDYLHHPDNTLLRHHLPPIRRAHEWYLYSVDGRKIFDMYLSNGRALFGHKPYPFGRRMKQSIDQGLFASLPTKLERHLFTQCRSIFHEYERFYIFHNTAHLIDYARAHIAPNRPIHWLDPAITPMNNAPPSTDSISIAIGRPLLRLPTCELLAPLAPFPYESAPQLLCQRAGSAYTFTSSLCGGFMLRALRQAIQYFAPSYQSHAIRHRNRHDYITLPRPTPDLQHTFWKQNGNYLLADIPADAYPRIFQRYLEHDILINPSAHAPTILPFNVPRADYMKFVDVSVALTNRD